jgi:hypothetical protein
MPLPLLAAASGAVGVLGKIGGAIGGIFKKKPGGTKVGNFIRGIFGKKNSSGPVATATPPIVAVPKLQLSSNALSSDEAGSTANTDKQIPVWVWIVGGIGALLLIVKRPFK